MFTLGQGKEGGRGGLIPAAGVSGAPDAPAGELFPDAAPALRTWTGRPPPRPRRARPAVLRASPPAAAAAIIRGPRPEARGGSGAGPALNQIKAEPGSAGPHRELPPRRAACGPEKIKRVSSSRRLPGPCRRLLGASGRSGHRARGPKCHSVFGNRDAAFFFFLRLWL